MVRRANNKSISANADKSDCRWVTHTRARNTRILGAPRLGSVATGAKVGELKIGPAIKTRTLISQQVESLFSLQLSSLVRLSWQRRKQLVWPKSSASCSISIIRAH